MKNTYKVAVILLTTLLVCPILLAEEELEPGNWEKVEKLQRGAALIISMYDGEKRECSLRRFGPTSIGHASFTDGSGETHYSTIRSVYCLGVVPPPISEQIIESIILIDKDSGVEKTIYISPRGALRKARKEAGLPITPLIDSAPIPGHWDKLSAVKFGEPLTVYKTDGETIECSHGKVLSKTFFCMNTAGKILRIDKNTIERVTTFEKESGSERTIYISEETPAPDQCPE